MNERNLNQEGRDMASFEFLAPAEPFYNDDRFPSANFLGKLINHLNDYCVITVLTVTM